MSEQGTEQWHQERLGKVTASRIYDVMMKPTTAGYQNYRAQLVCERLTGNPTETPVSAAMQHGTDTEPQARAFFEMSTGFDVSQVGFIPHPTIPMSGASPDGVIGDDALVEIKCPQPAQHIKTLTGAAIDRKYILQMQWQMACTARTECHFVSFSPAMPTEMQMFHEVIHRDDDLVKEITDAVSRFLSEVESLRAKLSEQYMEAA